MVNELIINEDDLVPSRPKLELDLEKSIGALYGFTLDYFQDRDLFLALPTRIRHSKKELSLIIENSGKFDNIIHIERDKRHKGINPCLFGEKVYIPETMMQNNRKRRAQEGYRINVEYIVSQGIDPTKVMFFRVTMPLGVPKPEYFWTSDYFETVSGLTAEIPYEDRQKSIILVADLLTINQNGGLIQDINDDNGLAVRQIGTNPFDQRKALTSFKPNYPTRLKS